MDVYNGMSYYDSVKSFLLNKRQRALSGLYNCIPFPFPRFKIFLPGTQMGKYIICTANQKVGKTKFCDFVYVYETLFFIMEHPEVKVKILYFCLEESPRKKYTEFLCHLLYRLDRIEISPTELESTDKDHPVPQEILDKLDSERYQRYIKKFEEMVEYIDSEKNPTGINKKCRDYALSHGHLNFKEVDIKELDGTISKRKIIDPVNPYTADDSEEYRIAILDNTSNLSTESGMKKMETVEKMSKYFITLRDQLNFTIVCIQHQAQAQEGIENFKLNRIKPSSDGLADCKTTTRDANMVIGLYSPFKYGLTEYEKYDITKFRNHIRFMEIIEDRDYGANGNICPLYFDGAVSFFKELPKPDDYAGMQRVYEVLERKKKTKMSKVTLLAFMFTRINKFIHNDSITNRKKCSK